MGYKGYVRLSPPIDRKTRSAKAFREHYGRGTRYHSDGLIGRRLEYGHEPSFVILRCAQIYFLPKTPANQTS